MESIRDFDMPKKESFFDPRPKKEYGCGIPAFTPTLPTSHSLMNFRAALPTP